MKKEIIVGILLLLILTPIFVYLRMNSQQRHAIFAGKADVKTKNDREKKIPAFSLNLPKTSDKTEVKSEEKRTIESSKPLFKKAENRGLEQGNSGQKPEQNPNLLSPWKGERPTWMDKPVIGLRQKKLYYKPGDVGYFSYRNLKDEADYFKTVNDAEKAGYKSARKKEGEETGS